MCFLSQFRHKIYAPSKIHFQIVDFCTKLREHKFSPIWCIIGKVWDCGSWAFFYGSSSRGSIQAPFRSGYVFCFHRTTYLRITVPQQLRNVDHLTALRRNWSSTVCSIYPLMIVKVMESVIYSAQICNTRNQKYHAITPVIVQVIFEIHTYLYISANISCTQLE